MDLERDRQLKEQLAAKAEAERQWQNQREAGGVLGVAGMGISPSTIPAQEPHPRETVLAQIEEAESVLFRQLAKIREIKQEVKYLGRSEAKLILDLTELYRPRY